MPVRKADGNLVYMLEVTLKEIQPPIWRRFQVPGSLTLAQLHAALQIIMGWTDSHLHRFIINGQEFGRPDYEERFADDDPIRDERRSKSGSTDVRRLRKWTSGGVLHHDVGLGVGNLLKTKAFVEADGRTAAKDLELDGLPLRRGGHHDQAHEASADTPVLVLGEEENALELNRLLPFLNEEAADCLAVAFDDLVCLGIG
jgi:hypothetical protein